MSEKASSLPRSRKLAVATTVAAALFSLEACSPSDSSKTADDNKREIALSDKQTKRLHKAARQSANYDYDAVLHPNKWGVFGGFSEGPHGQSARQPFKLGETVTFVDFLEEIKITPTVEGGTAYVSSQESFWNFVFSSETERILANPNEAVFGSDGIVSKEEMLAFYADNETALVSTSRVIESDIDPSCSYSVELDGNNLTYMNNDGDGCHAGDTSDAELANELTRAQ